MYSCYCTYSYISKFNTLRKLSNLNDQAIDSQIYLMKCTNTLSVHSVLQTFRLRSYLVSTRTTKGQSAALEMLLVSTVFSAFPSLR